MARGPRSKRPPSPADLFGDSAGPGGPQALTLTVESGTHAGKRVTIRGSGSMGRSSKCELCLRGAPGVSRRHARIERRGDRYVVFDTESRNGIILNGVEIAGEAQISDGDLLELSDEHIRITFGADDFEPLPTEALPSNRPTNISTDDVDTRPAPRATRNEDPHTDSQPRPMGLESAAALLADVEEPIPLERKKPEDPRIPDAVAPMSIPHGLAPSDLPPPMPPQGQPPPRPVTLPSAELQPLGVPSDSGQPLGIPSGDGPYLDELPSEQNPQDSAFPTAAAESPSIVAPQPRRGSTLMFLVGGLVGLILALSVVILGDHFANNGALRETLTRRINTLLEPYDVKVPTLEELMGEGAVGVAADAGTAEPVSGASADAGTEPSAADAGVRADAAPVPTAPVVVKAERALIVVTVFKKKGDAVNAGDPLLGVAMGDEVLLKKKLELEKEKAVVDKKARRKGKKAKKAKKRLRALNAELGKLMRKLDNTKLSAPSAGVVDAVVASSGVVLNQGAELVRLAPPKAP
jgi:biotin carboxyl carrier protein